MTGRILTFILGVTVTLYLAVLYKSNGILFIFYTEILIGSIMFLMNLSVILNIKVKLETEPVVNRSGELKFGLTIENRSILPSGRVLLTVNCLDPYTMKSKKTIIEQWCSVRSAEKHLYSFRGSDGEILSGKYVVSIKKISVYDYLGFFKLTKKIKNKDNATCIIPVIDGEITESAEDISNEIEKLVSVKKSNTGEFSHVREYRNGDKLRNIHWKLSAKSDEIYVKEFSEGCENYLCYYIETKPLNRKEIAKEFEKWSIVGNQAIESGNNIIFIWYDFGQKYVRKAYVSNVEELYRALCEINSYDGRKNVSDEKFVVNIDMLMEMEKKG